MPVFGLNNGVVPIVAYNYGAQNRLRMVETIKRSTIYASCIMVLGVIIFWAIPGPLLKIFDATDTMLQVGVPALRIISLSFCMAGACIALGSSFQALGKAVYSMTTSIIRQLVFLVPIAYVLARYGHSIGNDDLVWWSYPLAEIASLLVTGGCTAPSSRPCPPTAARRSATTPTTTPSANKRNIKGRLCPTGRAVLLGQMLVTSTGKSPCHRHR